MDQVHTSGPWTRFIEGVHGPLVHVLSLPQQDALHQLQVILRSDCVIGHYNQAAEMELKVAASPVGLGAILLQQSSDNINVHPVAYASRTSTDVERRYSQTEKETLAVVWACKQILQQVQCHLSGSEWL